MKKIDSRRRALTHLLASTPFATLGLLPRLAGGQQNVPLAATPSSLALNVFDLEEAARAKLPTAHFAYLATGVEADATLRANREGFSRYQIRPRRLVDTSRVDMSVQLFGQTWPTPIVLAPVSSLRAFDPEGDVAVARAAKARNHLQILSTLSTHSVENVAAAREAPIWFQLYPTANSEVARRLVRRAEAAGCPVLALTVDNPTAAGRETLARGRRLDTRDCSTCHATGPGASFRTKPNFEGLDMSKTSALTAHLTWDFVKELRAMTSMKILLKGIVTGEDARLALEHGVDGLIVSNHGGRGEESARSTIEALPEVIEATGRRIPVLVDSGFRRGTDIFKALALGANAVCVGRPYVWGLAAYGQVGVERCLDILRLELETTMRSVGTPNVKSITQSFVVRA